MVRVLDVRCMPRGERSNTKQVHTAFLEGLEECGPPATYTIRDLVADVDAMPTIDAWDVEADCEACSGERRLDEEMATRWRQVIALTDELHECDLVLISAPMWNFSVPWHLKRWIDCVVQARLTFSTNGRGHEGLLRGRPCVLLISRDGLYRGRDATPGADFQIPYLRHVLGFMGLGPVYAVAADGMALPDRTLSLVAAQGEARSLARTVTALLRAPSSVREVP